MNFLPFVSTNPVAFYLPDGLAVPADQCRYRFYAPDTTTDKNVYDIDGNSLGSRVNLNAAGQLVTQVFLGEYDYDVMLQVYVSGDISLDASWNDVWDHVYRVKGALSTASTGVSMIVLETIADIYALTENHGYAFASVLGYYSATDLGGNFFYWDSDSTATDDKGYTIRPSDSTGAGRWIKCLYKGQSTIATSEYGMGTGITGTVDSRMVACEAKALSLGMGLVLSPVSHSFSSNYAFSTRVEITTGFRATAPDTNSIRVLSFTNTTTVQPRAVGTPINTYLRTRCSFNSGVVSGGVRPEWWDNNYSSGAITTNQVSNAVSYGGGVIRFTAGLTYDISTSPITAQCNIEQDAVLSLVEVMVVNLDGPIIVGGSPFWKVFEIASDATLYITNKHTAPVEAWWFGWNTSNSETQTACLKHGYMACTGSNHEYHICSNQLGSDSYIDASAAFTDTGVRFAIDDYLTVTTGGTLTIVNIPMERRKMFAVTTDVATNNIILRTGIIYPEWFGTAGNGSTNDFAALKNAIQCAGLSQIGSAITWVDLGGRKYLMANTATLAVTYVGIKNGHILNGGYDFSGSSHLEFRDMYFEATSSTNASFNPGTASNVKFDSCTFLDSSGHYNPLYTTTGNNQKYINCTFSKTNSGTGVPFYVKYGATNIEFDHCSFNMAGSNGYWGGVNVYCRNCNFTSSSLMRFYFGWDANNESTGENGFYTTDCTFYKILPYVCALNNVNFDRNRLFVDVYQTSDTYITLQPRNGGTAYEPLDYSCVDNVIDIISNIASVASFTLVSHDSTYGAFTVSDTKSYVIGSDSGTINCLFSSLIIGNNTVGLSAKWSEYTAFNNTFVGSCRAKSHKTFGSGRVIVYASGDTSVAVDDNYIGTTCQGVASIVKGTASVNPDFMSSKPLINIISPYTNTNDHLAFQITTSARFK